MRGIQYSRDSSDRSRPRGVLDYPPSRVMTAEKLLDRIPRIVIASASEEIQSLYLALDCFVACAPRNDGTDNGQSAPHLAMTEPMREVRP
jgi:hypothetical protein